jgi:Domain of unknown function (DUF6457)
VDEWLTTARDALAATSGVPPAELELDAATATTLLELARRAAHESGDRRNAPLLTYLVGRAAAGGTDVDSLAAAVGVQPGSDPFTDP